MKKSTLFNLLVALWAIGLLLSCGGGGQQQVEEEQLHTEIQQLDSISTELDTVIENIEQNTEELKDALDALDTGEEQ
ncbi:MAG: hypothetical protein H6560_04045 [Lewinellaceae bacterium]|nr:hypothetical protein [Lewinellaceae bacterium]